MNIKRIQEIETGQIKIEEIQIAIKKLNNDKGPAMEGIHSEMLKYVSDSLDELLKKFWTQYERNRQLQRRNNNTPV